MRSSIVVLTVLSIFFFTSISSGAWDLTNNPIDNNTSDVDSSADKGTETSFSNCQGSVRDSSLMTLQESDYGSGAVSDSDVVNGYTATTNQWTPSGTTPYLSADDGTNYISTATTSYVDRWFTFGDTTATGSGFTVVLYVDFDAGDGDDDCNWAIDCTGDDTAEFSGTFNNPTTSIVNTGTISGLDTATEYNNARLSLTSVKGGSKMNTLNVDYAYITIERSAIVNYCIDFEYQWTTAIYNKMVSTVCFYVDGHTGSETLNVNYRNGGSWVSLTTITGTGWKNVTATGLSGSTYTFQVIGATESSDSTQDSWTFDCIFLQTYDKLTVYNNTVDVTGKYEISGDSINGWSIWLNFTGVECPDPYTIDLNENIINATGSHEYVLDGSVYRVWANYTGNTTPLLHYENIVGATGSHDHVLTATGYKIWANYTGLGSPYSLKLVENIINATGSHEYTDNGSGYTVYANYTGTGGSSGDPSEFLLYGFLGVVITVPLFIGRRKT